MADDKKSIPTRTMRSDPPTHPAEVLRTVAKGCVESIRNRKGVSDSMETALAEYEPLNANESALEFLPEVAGQRDAKILSGGSFTSLDDVGGDEGGGDDSMFMIMGHDGVSPSPEIQDGGVQIQSFGRISSEPVTKAVQRKGIKRLTALEINNHFSFLIDEMEQAGAEYSGPELGKIYTIHRDPKRRPSDERISPTANPAQVRNALQARLKRLSGQRVTPLVKETLKEELRQFLFELIEMGLVERGS